MSREGYTSQSYVQESLGRNEKLIHRGSFHWMYTFSAIMNIVIGFFFSVIIIIVAMKVQAQFFGVSPTGNWLDEVRSVHPAVRLTAFFSFIMSLMRFAQAMVTKETTEIAVTTSRLIYKRGLVSRYVGEMSIDRIEGVNVLQSILGRILNYGRIMVRGMGVGEVVLPPLADPIKFRQAIETAKDYQT